MKKRNLYDEINAGLHHLEQARLGNATLHSVQREMKAAVTIDAKKLRQDGSRVEVNRMDGQHC
jgi:hypothetical protein